MERSRLGLILHPTRDVTGVVATIVDWAGSRGAGLAVRSGDRHRVPASVSVLTESELVTQCTALLSIGGDGTMLGALRLTVTDPKPVLGIHLGRFGFLTEVRPSEVADALDRLAAGRVTLEPHSCLMCDVCGREVVAFNDIALARGPGTGLVTATLGVDGQRFGYYRCDSVVVSTPTGSTAYSYAAGGPIVSPAADVVVVTPSAPMAGISRAVVLSGTDVIRLELHPGSAPVAVEADGLVVHRADAQGVVEVRYRRGAGLVVRLDPARYRERSQLKLSLLDLPLLPEQLRELLPDQVREQVNHRWPTPPHPPPV